jgi:AraC family transcriptional activator FtrA
MRAHLHEPLTIPALARQASLAERTLIRRFSAATGSTPVKWLTAQRVLHARQLLETSEQPVDQVASASGLGSPANFSPHFAAAVRRFPERLPSCIPAARRITKAVAYKCWSC